MNAGERRGEILKILKQTEVPIAARELAGRFGVSRQVIVQDLAVIRASTPGILSTTKGYVMQQDSSCTREFKVRHSQDKAAQELNLIVDCGGHVKNISISHRVYGRVSAEMDIRSRQDVSEFIQALQNSRSTVLSLSLIHIYRGCGRSENTDRNRRGQGTGNPFLSRGTRSFFYSGGNHAGTRDQRKYIFSDQG